MARKINHVPLSRGCICFHKAMEALRISWPLPHAQDGEDIPRSSRSDHPQTCHNHHRLSAITPRSSAAVPGHSCRSNFPGTEPTRSTIAPCSATVAADGPQTSPNRTAPTSGAAATSPHSSPCPSVRVVRARAHAIRPPAHQPPHGFHSSTVTTVQDYGRQEG